MSYPESVDYLYSLGNEVKSIKFGLEGVSTLLDALGKPHHAFRSVHVAGTNGKGSTSAMIESGLRQAGFRTALYTSPHLVEPTERIRIDGRDVTKEDFAGAFDIVHEKAENLVREGRLEHHTTYFETVTAMAFVLFQQAGVDIAVLETGLGGRLDATNVVIPELCVITPIDFDHEIFLGSSIESIAGEKAGILKKGIPAVFARQRPDAAQVLQKRAAELGIHAVRVEDYAVEMVAVDARGSEFSLDGLLIGCPLPGRHQIDNAATAAVALLQLGVRNEPIQRGISLTRWPGRLEYVHDRPDIILDGAHNPAGARALSSYIHDFHSDREIWLIYGAMRDKSVQEITEILFPLAQRVILTAPSSPRAVRPEALRETVDHPCVEVALNVAGAIVKALRAPASASVFVTGSLYLVGEARPLLVQ